MESCKYIQNSLLFDQRFYFVLQDDIQPPTDEIFAAKVEEIETQLEAIEESRRKIASSVYSYCVLVTEVFEKHKSWLTKLDKVNTKLHSCASETEQLHKGLPFLESLGVVSQCIGRIHCLELKLESTRVGVEQLRLLLASDKYAQAVVLYQKTIEKCEGDPFQNENGCEAIFKELQEQEQRLDDLPNLLTRQIQRVYRELRQFHQYATGLPKPAQEEYTEENHIEELITEKLSTLELNGFDQITYRLRLQYLLSNSKTEKIALRDDLCIRSGWFGIENGLTKLCNFDIKPSLDRLEEIALDLQRLQLAILSQLEDLYVDNRTSLDHKEIVLSKLASEIEIKINELRVQLACKSLYGLMSTKQIRVGLYYASRLSAFIEEVRFIADHFSTDTSPENKKVVEALKSTFRFISVLQTENRSEIEKFQSLFFTARDIATARDKGVSAFNGRIINCLHTLVARVGKKIYSEIKRDDKVWLQIVNGSYINHTDDDELQELKRRFVSYVQQEVTKWYYFSNKQTNIRLDMVIYTATHDQFFKEFLQYVLEEDRQFAQIYNAHKCTFSDELVGCLCNLFRLIRSCTLDLVFTVQSVTDGYSKSQSLISQIEQVMGQIADNQELGELIAFAKELLEGAKKDFKWLS